MQDGRFSSLEMYDLFGVSETGGVIIIIRIKLLRMMDRLRLLRSIITKRTFWSATAKYRRSIERMNRRNLFGFLSAPKKKLHS